MPHYTALVTMLAVLAYFFTGLRVGGARRRFGVPAPAITGNAEFERIFRVQMNTLEWMPIFLPLLWLFAFYVSDVGAAVLGLIWIGGRFYYMVGYTQAAEKREIGFFIQSISCGALLLGALIGVIRALGHGA
jgi:glutathione S-transferase